MKTYIFRTIMFLVVIIHKTEIYEAWCRRIGEATKIPSDSIQPLFNDIQLHPNKTQVVEMLQCARQCSRRNSSSFLTFGEFCVFAGELRKTDNNQIRNQSRKTSKTINDLQCEVFLGGSCNPTTWRADVAIPTLTQLGISYYNPQVSTWGPELMAAEHDAKESASVLLFVIDSQTRCVAGMIEVAHLVAKKRCLVLVIYPFTEGQSIMDEPLTTQEFYDLSEGQLTLLTLLRSQGVSVYNNLTSALQSTAHMLRGNQLNANIQTDNKLTDRLIKLRKMFDHLDRNGTGHLTMSEVCLAYYQYTNSMLSISDLYSIMDVSNNSNPEDVRINFEQFCSIITEFTTAHNKHSEWVNQPLQRQTSGNNNTYTPSKKYDIYLGGSYMKSTSWRSSTAIPLLNKFDCTYYNPQKEDIHAYDDGRPLDNSQLDLEALEQSRVLLFVITNETRCITTMILAAYFIALKRNVVLCIQQLPSEECVIGKDILSKQAIKDYNRARAYLSDMAKHEHVPVFESITEAVQCAVTSAQQHR